MSKRKVVVAVTAALLLASSSGFAQSSRTDDSQAQLFVRYLSAIADQHDAHALVDSLMNSPGTALIVAQQNLARRVSAAEYREVLLAVAENRQPALTYDRTDPRAAKGAAGLLVDVVPEIRWAIANLGVVRSNLAKIAALDVEKQARRLALENLPQREPLNVPLYLVMGGRAGAAALSDGIYYDVLVTSYRSPSHTAEAPQVVEFFAHELHHVGLGRVIDREAKTLHLDAQGERAFELLSGLVMEGSASYLTNGHRDLAAMRRDPGIAAPGTDEERMKSVAQVLRGVLEEGWTAAQYDEAMTRFAGNALHMTGAAMLDAIWQYAGRKTVMAVLRDPRQLLVRYNQAIAKGAQPSPFSAELAAQVASLGKR